MFTLDKLNFADLRLLFLAVNFKVNLGESLRRRIFEYTSSVTKVDLIACILVYKIACTFVYQIACKFMFIL